MSDKHFPIISLFCGAGGLDWGFRREGFKAILALDNSSAAVKSYNINTRVKAAHLADLSTISAQQVGDLMEEVSPGFSPVGVIGGPPCQGFSRGNARANPDDPRNLLPFKYADLLSKLNERSGIRFFVFENVMGLMNRVHIERFRAIEGRFKDAGFNIFPQDLNALAFGVPQNRRRLFIVGLNSTLFPGIRFEYPKGRGPRHCVRDAIGGLPAPAYFRRGMRPEEIPHHPNHWTMMPRSPKLGAGASTDGRSFRKLLWDQESPTVAYGNREIHIHPDGGRRLSVHEAMLLQGFPPSYRLWGNFGQQVTQVCNAVPPPIARALARRIRQTLSPPMTGVRP